VACNNAGTLDIESETDATCVNSHMTTKFSAQWRSEAKVHEQRSSAKRQERYGYDYCLLFCIVTILGLAMPECRSSLSFMSFDEIRLSPVS